MISDPEDLYRYLTTPVIEIARLMDASDDEVWAFWRIVAEEDIHNFGHTNEVIGAYITAGARMHFYSYLDRLKELAIYCEKR